MLPKGKKPPDEPSAYRPLCMLDSFGKILECIIYNRLELAIDAHGGLTPNQYGFTKRRSTIDAVNLVVGIAKRAISGERWKGGAKKYCAIVALDVKNAFNLARWDIIWKALKTFNVPLYIRKIDSKRLLH